MNISDNALKILQKRYFIEGESTPEQLFRRVAKAVASAEKLELQKEYEEKFYQLMHDGNFLPNSPTLMNAGTETKQFSACFVLPIEDTMESIFNYYKNAALISKSGGGVGASFSKLRPEGDKVQSTNGVASGPISWMKIQDVATEQVKQGGRRRGANMGVLRVDHPDIEKFICCKDDGVSLTNFNISVAITDEFMKAVEEDKEFELKFNGKVYKTVNARELFNKLCEHAWKTGDPGIIFIDRVNEKNPTPHVGEIESTNPCGEQPLLPYEACIASGTLVSTPYGIRKIEDLLGTSGYILSTDKKFRKYQKVVSKGVKPVYEITLKNKLTIKATEDHKFETPYGFIELKDLKVGNRLNILSSYEHSVYGDYDPLYEMFGWMHGDGWYNSTVGISFNYKDGDIDAKEKYLPLFKNFFKCENVSPLKDNEISYQIQTENSYALNLCKELGFYDGRAINKRLPKTFYKWTLKQQLSFMRGLFGADGAINGKSNSQIHLCTNSKQLAFEVQKFLFTLGIQSRIDVTVFNTKKRNPQYKVAISNQSARDFMHIIGFPTNKKVNKFNYNSKNYSNYETLEIVDISYVGEEEVYDVVEVEETNTFFANGIAVHNCNLGSINLANMITENNEIDWLRLERTVITATRFLDNIIDISEFPIPEIAKMVHGNRKIGLGIMGWADLLYQLEIPYDSEEALKLAAQVMQKIYNVADLTSTTLAHEKGSYPNAPQGVMRRNAALTTIAPTGTISIIFDVSGGCEPNFAIAYNRYATSMNQNFKFVNRFVEKKLKELGIYSEELLQKIIDNGGSVRGIPEIPQHLQRVFVTAQEISPEWHVRMQAAFQNNGVDSAVSKTVNMPNSATVQDVKDAYLLAYKLGCKGITIYRDGSKDSQVLTTSKSKTMPENSQTQKEQETKNNIRPRRRPKSAKGSTDEFKVGCGKLYLTVNVDENDQLLETFANTGTSGVCPGYSQGLSRMVSLALRCGVDPQDVIDQLCSVSCGNCRGKKVDAKSCPDAYGKAILKKYKESQVPTQKAIEVEPQIQLQQDNDSGEICPECGAKGLPSEGCFTCHNCGFSKCS